eukprot:8935-Heterococcus_DN1.PRE.1
MNNCKLGERKNMNLPGAMVDLPTLTEKHHGTLASHALATSAVMQCVHRGSDIDYIREVLSSDPAGANIKIIAKIENQEGIRWQGSAGATYMMSAAIAAYVVVIFSCCQTHFHFADWCCNSCCHCCCRYAAAQQNYDEILAKTDSIMVARGDMGMEIPPEKVFLAQKYMIRRANILGKPVVTATQMLESMITNPRPTRAECSDVSCHGFHCYSKHALLCEHHCFCKSHPFIRIILKLLRLLVLLCVVLQHCAVMRKCRITTAAAATTIDTRTTTVVAAAVDHFYCNNTKRQVANAVLDGTDCVMLSGETANGDYPEDAVKIMARICCEAENSLNNDALYQAVRNTVIAEQGVMDGPESVGSSAVKTAIDTNATMI